MYSLLSIAFDLAFPNQVPMPLQTNVVAALDQQQQPRVASINDQARLESSWQSTLALDPNNSIAHINLGLLRQEQGRYSEAIDVHQNAIRLDPNNAIAHDSLGMALYAQGRFTEAEAAHKKAIQLDSTDPVAYINLGFALQQQRRFDEAEKAFQRADRLGFDWLYCRC